MFHMIDEVARAIHFRRVGIERSEAGFNALAQHFIEAIEFAGKHEPIESDAKRFTAIIASIYLACSISDGQFHEAHEMTAYAVVGEIGHRARQLRIAMEN